MPSQSLSPDPRSAPWLENSTGRWSSQNRAPGYSMDGGYVNRIVRRFTTQWFERCLASQIWPFQEGKQHHFFAPCIPRSTNSNLPCPYNFVGKIHIFTGWTPFIDRCRWLPMASLFQVAKRRRFRKRTMVSFMVTAKRAACGCTAAATHPTKVWHLIFVGPCPIMARQTKSSIAKSSKYIYIYIYIWSNYYISRVVGRISYFKVWN